MGSIGTVLLHAVRTQLTIYHYKMHNLGLIFSLLFPSETRIFSELTNVSTLKISS